MKTKGSLLLGLGVLAVILAASEAPNFALDTASQTLISGAPTVQLGANEKLITVLATNDIHGGVEPYANPTGSPLGGIATWSGIANAIRSGLNHRFGNNAGVVVVDAGDQFQGTLISNINEGQLVFATMNEVGYTAAITGNHDYDFGPIGWLNDQIIPGVGDQNPLGALLRDVHSARFPIISANTYFKNSIFDTLGNPVPVSGNFCAPPVPTPIDWKRAKIPDFLKAAWIVKTAGIRVALIGIDNPETPSTTTAANVAALCFADPATAYLQARAKLEGQADVFVMVMHEGDTFTQKNGSIIVQKILQQSAGHHVLDAVIAGHTHYVNNEMIGGVPMIQSASGGALFGRIDLVWNTQTNSVEPAKTRAIAGIPIFSDRCGNFTQDFCAVDANHRATYEGSVVTPNLKILALIGNYRNQIAPLANRILGQAAGVITIDRLLESPLADQLTDALRKVTNTDISFINTSGIRTDLAPGPLTYEEFFRVLPMNNHAVRVGPITEIQLLEILHESAMTCGAYGTLIPSGLRVVIGRDCAHAIAGRDLNAVLLHVETLAGEVLLDVKTGKLPNPSLPARIFTVATLDFIANGGAGYHGFIGLPRVELPIFREMLTQFYLQAPVAFTPQIDGRWAIVPGP